MGMRVSGRGYRARVYLFAGLMVFLILTSLAFTFGVVWYSKRVSASIVEKDFKARKTERAMVDLLLSMDRNRKKFLLLGRPEYKDRFQRDAERFRQECARLQEVGLTEAERPTFESLKERFEEYLRKNTLEGAGTHATVGSVSDLPLEEVHRLLRLNQDRMDLRIEQLNHLEAKTLQAGLLWTVLSLVAAGLSSFFLIRSITRPIDALRKGTQRIAQGDFSYRVELSTRDELGELAEAFNQMSYQLKRLDEMKADFIAIVSHELKTPLTSMKEAVGLLMEEAVGPLNRKQRRLLLIGSAGIDRLTGFVDDILNLTRMEGGLAPLYRARFDLQTMMEERLEGLRLLADKKRIRLTACYDPDPLPPVFGDAERLMQVFSNLLNNAISFTPPGGSVSLRVERANARPPRGRIREASSGEPARYWLRVEVRDTGEGIPTEEWQRVFDKFYQIRRRSKRGTGSGLGLTIAKYIVEAHGGGIWVETSSDKGTVFVVVLPQPEVPEERPRRGLEGTDRPRPCHA